MDKDNASPRPSPGSWHNDDKMMIGAVRNAGVG